MLKHAQKAIRLFSSGLASIPMMAGLSGQAAESTRVNVLFIAVDDLKPTIGCYGDTFAITPNLDRLAERGAVFLNNHCQLALCGPSRGSLMTGLRPDSTGMWWFGDRMRELNPDALTLPQHFKNHGYTTAAIGKIYDPRNVNDQWDSESWSIPHKTYGDYRFHPDYPKPVNGSYHNSVSRKAYDSAVEGGLQGYHAIDKYMREHNARPSVESMDVPDNAYVDGAIALRAVEMLKELDRSGKPFFLAVGFAKPHLPFIAPKKYWDLYDREKISIHPFQKKSSNPVDFAYHGSGELKGYTDISDSMDSYSDDPGRWLAADKQKELIHGYYACTSYVDAQIGKLLDELEDLGLSGNTVVVVWGDHGFHLGDHGLWHKHTNFEQATRSPLIIRDPALDQGMKTEVPTEFIDLFPTLCELSGLPAPDRLDGISLVPLMKKEVDSVKPFAVSQYPSGGAYGYTMRTERYRYTEWMTHDWRTTMPFDPAKVRGRELYDYQEDPMETENRVDFDEYADIQRVLQGHLHRFFEECRLTHIERGGLK